MPPEAAGCIAPIPSTRCWPRRIRHEPRWAQMRCGNWRCWRCGCRAWRAGAMGRQVRALYGASLSPDGTAFAPLIDDVGYRAPVYPRARHIYAKNAGTANLIAWDGVRVAAILTGEDGIGRSCLIDPADG